MKRILLIACVLLMTITARAQSCDVMFTASLGGCDNVYTAWLTKRLGAVSQTLTFDNLLTGKQTVVDLAPSVRSYSLTGTGPGAHFNVLIVMDFGAGKCSTTLHDLHNRPPEQCSAAFGPITILNSANGRSQGTADSIATAYGDGITTVTASAITRPLPTQLGNVQVTVDGQQVGIFFVSPNQINFHVPPNLTVGLHSIRATNVEGKAFSGEYYIGQQAPGVFTRDMTGGGPAAADYGPGYVSLWVTGVNSAGLGLSDVWIQTSSGKYFAQYIEGADGRPSQFIGVKQLNFLNVPASGQGAELHVAGFVSQGFTLQR